MPNRNKPTFFDVLTDIVGICLVAAAGTSYFIDWPSEGDWKVNVIEFAAGVFLVKANLAEKIEEVWCAVLDKFFPNRKRKI